MALVILQKDARELPSQEAHVLAAAPHMIEILQDGLEVCCHISGKQLGVQGDNAIQDVTVLPAKRLEEQDSTPENSPRVGREPFNGYTRIVTHCCLDQFLSSV